jgi:hypothetical protein
MTPTQLEKLVKNKAKALLFFNADYCDACHQTYPIMEQIKELKSDYQYYDLDVDDADNDEISELLKIDYMPTLIILSEDKLRRYDGRREIIKYLESQD